MHARENRYDTEVDNYLPVAKYMVQLELIVDDIVLCTIYYIHTWKEETK
jgi:hypothetical protein